MKRNKKNNRFISYLKGLKKKEKLLLFISILIFTFIIIQEGIVRPLTKEEDNLQNEIATLKSKKIDAITLNAQKDNLEQKLQDVTFEYNEIVKAFLKTEGQASIINDLITISKKNNLNIIGAKFKSETTILGQKNNENNNQDENNNKSDKKNSILVHSGTVTVRGDFISLVQFIKKIENMKREITVTNVELKKAIDGNNNSSVLEGVITFNYYNLNYKENEKYDFNKGKFGKQDYFK